MDRGVKMFFFGIAFCLGLALFSIASIVGFHCLAGLLGYRLVGESPQIPAPVSRASGRRPAAQFAQPWRGAPQLSSEDRLAVLDGRMGREVANANPPAFKVQGYLNVSRGSSQRTDSIRQSELKARSEPQSALWSEYDRVRQTLENNQASQPAPRRLLSDRYAQPSPRRAAPVQRVSALEPGMPLINTFLPLRICHSNLFNFTPAVRDLSSIRPTP
jgi:hypothetical protein